MRVCVFVAASVAFSSVALGGTVTIEPDDFGDNSAIGGVAGVTLQSLNLGVIGAVYAQNSTNGVVSTGSRVFDPSAGGTGVGVWEGRSDFLNDWNTKYFFASLMRVDFDDPSEFTEVSIDFIGNTVDPTRNIGRMQAFDVNGNLVADSNSGPLAQFEVATGTVTYAPGIAFVIIGGDLFDDVGLDNLVLSGGGEVIPLPSAAGLAGIGLLGLGVRRRR